MDDLLSKLASFAMPAQQGGGMGKALPQGMTPQGMPGNGFQFNRFSSTINPGPGTNLFQASQHAQQNPNPAANLNPKPGLATPGGIQQAMQKASQTSSEAQLGWLDRLMPYIFNGVKQAESSSTGTATSSPGSSGGSSGGSGASSGMSSNSFGTTSAPQGTPANAPGSQNQQQAQAGGQPGMGNMPGMSNGQQVGAFGIVQPGWQSLKPNSGPSVANQTGALKPGLGMKLASMLTAGPGGMPPTPGLTANAPPPQPGMPSTPPGAMPPPPPNGGAPIDQGMGQPSVDPATGQPLPQGPPPDPNDPNAQAAAGGAQQGAPPGLQPPVDPMTGQPVSSPMQDPPPPTLPSNPRMFPPRAMQPSDQHQNAVSGGLGQDMHMANNPITQQDSHEDLKSGLMAMDSKTATDWYRHLLPKTGFWKLGMFDAESTVVGYPEHDANPRTIHDGKPSFMRSLPPRPSGPMDSQATRSFVAQRPGMPSTVSRAGSTTRLLPRPGVGGAGGGLKGRLAFGALGLLGGTGIGAAASSFFGKKSSDVAMQLAEELSKEAGIAYKAGAGAKQVLTGLKNVLGLNSDTPRSTLGYSRFEPLGDLGKKYRGAVAPLHPDRGGDPTAFRKVQDAYERLSGKQPSTPPLLSREGLPLLGGIGAAGTAAATGMGVGAYKVHDQISKQAADVVLADGTNLGDAKALGEKIASKLYATAGDNPVTHELGYDKQSGDYNFDAEDCPKCGASMEGDSYTGTCNSCQHKWGTKKEASAVTPQMIVEALAVAARNMEKQAIGVPSWATKGVEKGVEFGRGLFGFGSKAPKALPPGPGASTALVPHATANPAGYAAWSSQASKAAPGGAYRAGQYLNPVTRQVAPSAGGAVLGATGGDKMPGGKFNEQTGKYEGGGTGDWMGNAAVGAFAFNPFMNRMMGGRGAKSLLNSPMRAVQGGLLGEAGGAGLDQAAAMSGMEGTNFAHTGAMLGTGFGGVSGAGRTLNKWAPHGSQLGQFGKKMQQFGEGGLAPITTPIRAAGKALGMGGTGGLGAPTSWLGRNAGLGTGSTPFGAMNAATHAGNAGRKAALGIGGFMGAQNLVHGAKRDAATTFRDTADSYLEARLPELQQYGRDSMDGYLQDRGMMDERGHFNPMRPAMDGIKQQAGGHIDNVIRQLGMDPARMGSMQKMMLLGGGLAAGGGLVAGSPLLAAGGGLAAMGGLLPHLMPGQGQQQLQGQFGQGQPQQSNAPPWMRHIQSLTQGPGQRNEFQHQQGMQQPQG